MLTGEPEFDMEDPVGAAYARKFEKGYVNACSMGHQPISVSEDPKFLKPGQTLATVTETELLEISMCNIPGDQDAVGIMKLNNTDGGDLSILKLSNNIQNIEMNKIAAKLGLPADATENEIINLIDCLQLSVQAGEEQKIENLLKLGVEKGIVNEDNKSIYEKLAKNDFENCTKLIDLQSKKEEVKPATLSIADQLKSITLTSGVMKPEEVTFAKLSKENPTELLRIKQEQPELYKKLATEYKP
jgi:hypothetical protein